MNDDLREQLAEFNDSNRRGSGVIRVPNERLAALWYHELLGQLSDGAWENHWYNRRDSWEDYHALQIVVDTDLDAPVIEGSTIEGTLPDFLDRDSSTPGDLVDIIGDRMAEYVRRYDHPDYGVEAVRNDLRLLNDATLA